MTQQIDFLPESYHRARQCRNRLIRQVVLIGCIAGCLFAATVGMKAHSRSQSRTAERLEDTVRSERAALGVIAELNHERKQLLKSFDLKRELEPPVTYTQVLASLGHVLPEGVAITELSMVSIRPKPEPAVDVKSSGRKQKNKDKEVAQEPNLIEIQLHGLSPDDLTVAMLVSALDEHPMFSRVTMRSSQGVNTQGLMAREFSLTATVDLDREFRWVSNIAEEVARAE